MKKVWVLLPVAVLCLWAVEARGQGGVDQSGCQNSPENPTAVLALVGSAGAGVAMLRTRWMVGKGKKK